MTTNDEWVRERAERLIELCCAAPETAHVIEAALREATERGRAEGHREALLDDLKEGPSPRREIPR